MTTRREYRPGYRLPYVLLISILIMLLFVAPGASAQGPIGGSDVDSPPPLEQAPLSVEAAASHYGSSPFAPPEQTDSTFVVDRASGLDTGCTYRSGGPLVFDIQVDRYPGDIQKLLASGRAGATVVLRMPAYDVDYYGGGSGTNPERDRVSFNGRVVPTEYLTGDNNVWKLNAFSIPLEWVNFPSDPGDGGTITPRANTIRIDIDTANSREYWCTAIDWAALSIDVPRPLLMAHGINSSGATWYMWTNNLASIGVPAATLDMGNLDSIENNAVKIGNRVDGLLQRWGVDTLNILGHSHGGLDARHYAENHNTVDKVTQIGTPNAGSPLADLIQQGGIFLLGTIPTAILDLLAGPASYQLTTPYLGIYNAFHGHNPNVSYVSVAGDYRWGGWSTFLDVGFQAFYGGAHDTIVPVWSVHALNYAQHLTYASTGSNKQAVHTNQTGSIDIYDGYMPEIIAEAASGVTSVPVATNSVGGSIRQGEIKAHTLVVDGAGPVTFLLFHGSGELDLTLTSPSGQYIDPSVVGTNPNVAFERVEDVQGLRYQIYAIDNPEVGNWTLQVTAQTVPDPPGEEPYVLTGLISNSPIQLQATMDRSAYYSGEPIILQAALQGSVSGSSASVEAKVVYPDRTTFDMVTLTDDGTAGDPVAGDGTYTGSFTATAQPGLYQILITATGHAPAFGRSVLVFAPVSANTSQFDGTFTGGGADTDGDGLFNELTVNVGLSITAPGRFRVVGVLTDPAGVEMETATASASLPTGTQMIALSFDGENIFQHGVDGPYTLTLVRLAEDTSAVPLPLDERNVAYTSPPYRHDQFQHPAIYFPRTGYDHGIDTNSNGRFDWLEVGVDVDLTMPGYYNWSGHLIDSNGNELGFVASARYMNAGPNQIIFGFPGIAIGQNGVNGPYYLNDLLIYTGTNSATVFHAYTTAAYDVQQFEGAPARNPLLTVPGTQTVQYSDRLSFEVSATDPDDPTSSLIFSASGLPSGLALTDHGDGTATVAGTIEVAPGTYSAQITVTDPDGLSDTKTVSIVVSPEDARATYTGALYASTSGATSSGARVTLAATVQDVTAIDPNADPEHGDIRYATLAFVNRDTGVTLCAAPIGLVDPSDPKTGTAVCDWDVTITGDSQSFTIGIVVGGYYSRNASTDDSVVTVAKPLTSNFITGGGYLLLSSSAGQKAGDAGTKNNFGYSIKYNRGGRNLQGHINTIVRHTEPDGVLHTYQIKGNRMTSLSVNPATGTAVFNGNASIQDITDPLNPIPVDGNATLQVAMTDRGEPGTSDSIAITIWNKSGGLWFASKWNGTQTLEDTLSGGNLVVR